MTDGNAAMLPSEALGRVPPVSLLSESLIATPAVTRYGFHVGNIGLLIAPGTACEVVSSPQPTLWPRTPFWFAGVMNLRGTLLPVFDLRELLALPAPQPATPRAALVLDEAEHAASVLIDGLPAALTDLAAVEFAASTTGPLQAHVRGAYRAVQQIWFEFDHRGLFASLGTHIGSRRT